MPIVQTCDADCETVLKPGEVHVAGWGQRRIYSPEAIKDVDAYYVALKEGAAKARLVFEKHQIAAAKSFHKKYPNGKLPDEPAVDATEEKENVG